jgi:hypothetical protein
MTRIVTSYSPYRYKRPPSKKKPAMPLEGPAVITIRDKKRVTPETPEKILGEAVDPARNQAEAAPAKSTPAGTEPSTSAIVTIRSRRKPTMLAHLLEDMTPEEHKRRGDGADAMMREFKRLIDEAAAKEKP